jgi:hemolysin III
MLRDPISAATHLLFALWSAYATVLMCRLSHGDRCRRNAVAVFGLSMVSLYAASGAYHAISPDWPSLLEHLRRLDLSLIHVLIAGTCTPVFAVLLAGRLRVILLALVWGVAGAGVLARFLLPLPVPSVNVALYAAAGMLVFVPLPYLVRAVGTSGLAWLVGGALIYSVGGLCEVLRWPVVWPGVIGPHEILHLCDMGGSTAHLVFVLQFVLPAESPSQVPAGAVP